MTEGHVQIMPDGSVSDGFMCDNDIRYWKRCNACKQIMREDVEEFLAANGGWEGVQRRAELANAFALDRTTIRPRTIEKIGMIDCTDIIAHFKQQEGFCRCEKRLIDHRWEIDHLTPVKRSGKNSRSNIQLLCAPCNKDKGNKTQYEWENGLAPRHDEWSECEECGDPIRAIFRLCYPCKYEQD